jgi:PhnB protein
MFKKDKFATAVFLTFSGNCQQALTLYQACFGGSLRFETFGHKIPGYREWPVVSGSLVSERVVIHGSDLVHDEGRKLGNYMAIFLSCKNALERKALVEKLHADPKGLPAALDNNQKLIEIRDAFDVRWVLSL